MSDFQPQNLIDRLKAKGQDLADRAETAANTVANNVAQSSNISVGGIASAVEGALGEVTGATVDLTNSINGITGPALGAIDLAQGGITNLLQNKVSSAVGPLGTLLSGSSGAPFPMQGYTGKQPNMLEEFSSYNYVFTLGCLTDFELNFPDLTYRYKDPIITILKSGGGSLKGSKTIYETNGKTEYFIDNVEIETLIAPNPATRSTNALSINFQILEPYSMGLFLQALQIAALSAGHKNYIQAPFCLSVEFKGYGPGGSPRNMRNARRIFPLKFVNVEFEVTEGGSQYAVQAIPFHESALTDQVQSTRNDISFEGRTVAEMLQWGFQSLTSVMNEKELEGIKENNKSKGNQYVVLFPTEVSSAAESTAFSKGVPQGGDDSATTAGNGSDPEGFQYREFTEEEQQRLYESAIGVIEGGMSMEKFQQQLPKELGIAVRRSDLGENIREYADKEENINPIGMSKIVKSRLDAGTVGCAKPGEAESEETAGKIDRCKVQVKEDMRKMTVSSGKKIEDIIEQVILLSDFGRSVVDQEPDRNGMLNWYRIETQTYQVTDHDNVDLTGKPPYIFVYRVVPYKVHHTNFTSPTEPAKGIDNLLNQACKEYNYIYTGKNKDILNFDINFKAAFFTGLAGDFGQKTADAKSAASTGVNASNKPAATGATGADTNTVNATPTAPNINTGNQQDAGGVFVHPESVVAHNFNEALINSPVDLITVDLEIWGDPFYIADSGVGNYNAPPGGTINTKIDGTMDYQSSEVDIEINFRTPVDYVGNYMTFPGGGFAPVSSFSGLYKVLFVSNKFSNGQFTQTLQTMRRPKQNTNQEAAQATGPVTATDPSKQIEKGETNDIAGAVGAAIGAATSAVDAATSAIEQSVGYGVGQIDPRLAAAAEQAKAAAQNVGSRVIEGTNARLVNGRVVGGL